MTPTPVSLPTLSAADGPDESPGADNRTMTPRELDEYRALRATIRERGTARVCLFVVGLALWVGLVLATTATMSVPVATLLPLLFLAALFEALFALHTGVERIGRYLQVFYEGGHETTTRRWEQTAMVFGRAASPRSPDPIFAWFFLLAAFGNFATSVLAGSVPVEWTVIGAAHIVFVVRVILARRRAAGQRASDRARFEQLRNDPPR